MDLPSNTALFGHRLALGYVSQFSSVTQSCQTLCNPMDCSTPGLPAAAAAAKSLQLCPTLCSPIDGSPPAPPSQDSQVTNTGVGMPFPSPKKSK